MADIAELKSMVMTFRVSELQVLLGFTGRSKSGRKQELLQRALSVISRGCPQPIQIKILELYKRRSPMRAANVPHPVQPPSQPPPAHMDKKMSKWPGNRAQLRDSGVPSYQDFKSSGSSGPPTSPPHLTMPVHPDVHFKRLPFYDVLKELLKPSSLVPRINSRFQEAAFVFHLTPQQAQDIAMSRDIRPGSIVYEYTVQIQLRFCLLETSCSQEDNFPPSICVRVNGKMAPLPNPIPTNKPGVEPKRPSRPVNITPICRISPTIPNQLQISWAAELGRSYCVAVYLVRKLSSDILLQRLKTAGQRHPDHTRALIKEKLAHDPDSEIATTSLRVSLCCPLGKMRMTIPTRASTCRHLQCFDCPTYLQMNERKPTWNCPVCDKPAEFDNLTIDGLFKEILAQSPDANEIQFFEDGNWKPMMRKENENSGGSHTIHTIDSPKKDGEGGGADVIDLTETDDEDNADGDVPMISCADSTSSSSSSASSTSGDSISSVTVVPSSESKLLSASGKSSPLISDSSQDGCSGSHPRDRMRSPPLPSRMSSSTFPPLPAPPPRGFGGSSDMAGLGFLSMFDTDRERPGCRSPSQSQRKTSERGSPNAALGRSTSPSHHEDSSRPPSRQPPIHTDDHTDSSPSHHGRSDSCDGRSSPEFDSSPVRSHSPNYRSHSPRDRSHSPQDRSPSPGDRQNSRPACDELGAQVDSILASLDEFSSDSRQHISSAGHTERQLSTDSNSSSTHKGDKPQASTSHYDPLMSAGGSLFELPFSSGADQNLMEYLSGSDLLREHLETLSRKEDIVPSRKGQKRKLSDPLEVDLRSPGRQAPTSPTLSIGSSNSATINSSSRPSSPEVISID